MPDRNSKQIIVLGAAESGVGAALLGKQQLVGIGAGLLAGLVLMVAMAALLARIDTTIHRPEEVQAMLGLRTIGTTPMSAKA